jgi:TonB family protein
MRVKTTLDHLLVAKPSGGAKWVLQSLLLALGLQVFILAILFFTTSNGHSFENLDMTQEVVEEEIPLMLDESNNEGVDERTNQEPMRNVMSESGSMGGDEIADYSGQPKDLSVEEFAQQEFERLKKEHAHDEVPTIKPVESNPKKDRSETTTTNSAEKSYQGAVSVEWKMAGRSVSQGPKPTYRCKQAGTVQVNVTIDEKGWVKQASIDPSSSNIECLRDESLSHAKRWKFNTELGKANQTGTIVFRFAAQ